MRVIGTETQSLERQRHLTGVQRVVTQLNDALLDELALHDAALVPFHTWRDTPRPERPWADFLERDRVLRRPLVQPEDADLCLFLDISHVDFPRLYRPALAAVPKVFFVHDVLPVTNPDWFPDGASRGYRLFLKQVLADADHIVCSTKTVAAQIAALGWPSHARLHVVPLGSFTSTTSAPRAATDAISLLYVSTVEPRKGHALLLDVFDRLLAAGVDVDLTLVGRRGWDVQHGWEVGDVIERIERHPELGGRLRWLQDADDATVRALAAQATVAVIPARDEGFGLFLEEALAMGLPVVASDIPVFAERPYPNVLLAERTPDAFAERIRQAQAAPWVDLGPGGIRTMRHAASDLAVLLADLC